MKTENSTINFYHLVILDASGSMDCIRKQALNGCNETLQSIRSMQNNNSGQQHFVTLLTFNSEQPGNYVYDNLPALEAQDMKISDYKPDSCTPLFDAVGFSLTHLQSKTRNTGHNEVLVTIITDGEENSSTVFDAKKIKSLINELKQKGWTFAFIGANINEKAAAESIGIHNTMAFEQTAEGASKMFRKLNKARMKYCMAAPCMTAQDRETRFFDTDD